MDQLHAGAFKCSVTRPAFKLSGWEFLMASIEMFIVIVKTSFKKNHFMEEKYHPTVLLSKYIFYFISEKLETKTEK